MRGTRWLEPRAGADGDRVDSIPTAGPVGLPPWLERPRLTAALEATACCPVTLVVAAAGWGKTAMLSEWRRGSPGRGAELWDRGGAGGRGGAAPPPPGAGRRRPAPAGGPPPP